MTANHCLIPDMEALKKRSAEHRLCPIDFITLENIDKLKQRKPTNGTGKNAGY